MIGDTLFLLVPLICKQNEQETQKLLATAKAKVVLGHFELNGYEMFYGKACESEHAMTDNLLQNFDFVGSGHFHQPSVKGSVHYLGAVGQYTWNDANCPRGFNIFDTETLLHQCK